MPEIAHSPLAYMVPGEDGDGARLHKIITPEGQEFGLLEVIDVGGRPGYGVKMSARQLRMLATAADSLSRSLVE